KAARGEQAALPYSCRRRAALATLRSGWRRGLPSARAAPHRSVTRISPDPYPLLRRQIQLIAGLHIESRVPGVEVANRPVHTIFRWAVGVAHDECTQLLIAIQGAPDLGPGQKESLLAGEAIQHRSFLAVQRQVIRFVCNAQTAQVADVLAERQPAVDIET